MTKSQPQKVSIRRRIEKFFFHNRWRPCKDTFWEKITFPTSFVWYLFIRNVLYVLWKTLFWTKSEKKEGYSRYENEFWRELFETLEKQLRVYFKKGIKYFLKSNGSIFTKKEEKIIMDTPPYATVTFPYFDNKEEKDELC